VGTAFHGSDKFIGLPDSDNKSGFAKQFTGEMALLPVDIIAGSDANAVGT
jgi:hypothetical protein